MDTGDINPNVAVDSVSNSAGELLNDSTGGPATFDELEETLDKKPSKKSDDKKPEPKKDEKNPDMTKDSDKSKTEPKKTSDEKSSKKEEPEQDAEDKGADTPAPKLSKFKHGESELDIDDEATVSFSVNGEETSVSLKDLKANYSGKVGWDKKFSELSNRNRQLQSREAKVNEITQKLDALVKETNQEDRIFRVAEIVGADPIQFFEDFLEKNMEMLEKYQLMSDDERKASKMEMQSKFHQRRADTLESSIQQEQAVRALKSEVDSLRASHNISEDEFAARYEEIMAYEDQQARINPNHQRANVNPEFVANSIVQGRIWEAADKALSASGMDATEKSQKLPHIVRDAFAIGLTPEQIVAQIDEVFGSGKTKRTIQKKKEQVDQFRNGGSSVSQAQVKKDEPVFFDDID